MKNIKDKNITKIIKMTQLKITKFYFIGPSLLIMNK